MNVIEKKIKKSQRILIYFFIILLAIGAYFITCFYTFPKELHFIEGSRYNLNFRLPVQAQITNENIGVVSINSQPVSDNISVGLDENILIEPDSSGNMNMQLSLLGIPLRNITLSVIPDVQVVPCGMTVGVRLNTNGVMVLGTGYVQSEKGSAVEPAGGLLKSGDLILAVDDTEIKDNNDLIAIVSDSKSESLKIKVKRENKIISVNVKPVISSADHKNKIGVWVRDSTQGIGTVTFYNPVTKRFGALGHGILDIDTKQLLTVRSGEILESEIISVKKGKRGSPGELLGNMDNKTRLGTITENMPYGIYGTVNSENLNRLPQQTIPVGLQSEVEIGPAKILSNIAGKEVREYDIEIESVNRYTSDNSKGMIVRITDKELLEVTNGIVQGMSGSPIIQNGKLIGAVTHVFVQDSSKGYGIFIENMIK